ncbi:hypothetical protein NUU61_009340 [Penicillium alfredii]|uniref:HMG box domain-containing protein n=1 Tax=Penicillium alfredii TaxID=1506179 RepID=A0A9W9EN68_9EURO|nr:uncharacterized protein NUU61_009340 [Penicillium alfredii]KAJ5084761.1 hypothetical protein NUU61_009340 [Penicillium alfredii]
MAPKHDKAEEATVSINVDELRNSKDSMLMRLMDLQSYVADLSKAYLEHANSVINGGPATIDIPPMHAGIGAHLDYGTRASSPAAKSEAGGQKKRKRAPPDPNAPKRALTPYFLYMQHNRAQIKQDLGNNSRPKDVADEGTRRWSTMEPVQKEVWKKLYADNLEKYRREMEAYKAKKAGEEDNDPAASQIQQDFAGAENSRDSESEDEDEDEDEDDTKRRRSEGKAAAKEVAESPVKQPSPQKKGKGKNVEPVSATKAKAPAEPKGKGKKRKSQG